MSDWREGYLEAVESFLREKGTFVGLEHYGKSARYSWEKNVEPDPNEYDSWDTIYGWQGWHYVKDGDGNTRCPIVSLDMSTIRERTLSQFQDTYSDNLEEVGVEVRATCACGQYENKWLRWSGSITDILPSLLQIEITTYYG